MLDQNQLLTLAELIHGSMRGRPPHTDDELHQAEQAAVHVADWFESKARWTPPGVDTITLATDDAAVMVEQAVLARMVLAEIVQMLRSTPTDADLAKLVATAIETTAKAVGE